MTYTYKQLYDRQSELQKISIAIGHREYTDEELALALFDEIGEVTHELKPLWCWWKTGGVVNPAKLIEELADVLHFMLIRDLRRWGKTTPPTWSYNGKAVGFSDDGLSEKREPKRAWINFARNVLEDDYYDADDFLYYADLFLRNLGLGDGNALIAAYFAKTNENLRRWGIKSVE